MAGETAQVAMLFALLCPPTQSPLSTQALHGAKILGTWAPFVTPSLTRLFLYLLLQVLHAKGTPILLFLGCFTIPTWPPALPTPL